MIITETNCETGETIQREMTEQEIANAEAGVALLTEIEANIEATRLARESALAKFQAIGLTEEEARSIFGGSSA